MSSESFKAQGRWAQARRELREAARDLRAIRDVGGPSHDAREIAKAVYDEACAEYNEAYAEMTEALS